MEEDKRDDLIALDQFPLQQDRAWFTLFSGPREACMEASVADIIRLSPESETVVFFARTDHIVHPYLAQVLDSHCILRRNDACDLEFLLKEHFVLLKQWEAEAAQLQLQPPSAVGRPKLSIYIEAMEFKKIAKEWWMEFSCIKGRTINVSISVIAQNPRQIPAHLRHQVDLVLIGCTGNQQVQKILYDEHSTRNFPSLATFRQAMHCTCKSGTAYMALLDDSAYIHRPDVATILTTADVDKHRGRYELYTMLRENIEAQQDQQQQVIQQLPEEWEQLRDMQ